MICYIFERLALMSLCGGILALVLLVLKPFTKRFFSPRWHYITYALSMLVFVIPLSIRLPKERITQEQAVDNVKTFIMLEHEEDKGVQQSKETKAHSLDYSKSIVYIWLMASGVCFGFSVAGYLIFKFRSKDSQEIDCRGILSKFGCKRLRVVVTDKTNSPMLLGLVKPKLYLPKMDYSHETLYNILSHECVHAKRRDFLVKWLCLVVKSLHFFNPLVYFLSKEINEQCEISCDALAVKNFDKERLQSYCETILSLVSKRTHTLHIGLGVSGTKKMLERRFEAIMNKKVIGKRIALTSAILGTIIILTALTVSALLGGDAEMREERKQEKQTQTKEKLEESLVLPFDNVDIPVQENDSDVPVLVVFNEDSNVEKSTNLVVYDAVNDGEIKYIVPVTDGDVFVSCDYIPEKHEGIDYAAALGTPVKAPISGKIVKAEYDYTYGNHIIIDSGEGYTATLAHLESMTADVGAAVNAGDEIGTVGSTGMSIGAHVHLEFNTK